MPVTLPTSVDQALATIAAHFDTVEADHSHLSFHQVEALFIKFAVAVHYIADEDLDHPRRAYCLWLAEKIHEDFPAVGDYDARGNYIRAVSGENGYAA